MAADLSKFRVPIGSLVVDASLVVALIWWGATMTERLDAMVKRLDGMDSNVVQIQADKRIAIMEARQGDVDRQLEEIKAQQARMESKIDRLLER